MAMDSGLRKEITKFLIELPLLQNKEGRQATLLSAGLQEALPHIDLSGSPYEFVARLIDLLETYTTLSDGRFALICFLQEIGNQLGKDRREILHIWCQQLPSQLKVRPIASHSYQRPISYLAPFQAPPFPQNFVSRPEITEPLKARLRKDEQTKPDILVVSAIHGLGGIGKSIAAIALARDKDIQERFPDGVLWVTLGQQRQLTEILSQLSGWIYALRDYNFRPTTVEAASAHLRTLLQDKAVLLVVDDVWESEHAIHFKVGGSRCQMLITTRRADVADEVGAELHLMDVMTPEQSLELLANRLEKTALEEPERKEALLLAEAVGRLPLALDLVASRVKDGTSWKDLYEALTQEIARLEELASPTERLLQGDSKLEASFNLSLNALKKKNKAVWEAFIWLGVLPEDVLISVPMATTLWELDESTTGVMLKLFKDHALLMPGSLIAIGDKEWPSYRLHDLLHDMARRLLTLRGPQHLKKLEEKITTLKIALKRTVPASSEGQNLCDKIQTLESEIRELTAKLKRAPSQVDGLGFSLQEAHSLLLELYKQRTQNNTWYTLPDDGYIHAHLTWHFQQAGQEDQIHALLREETAKGSNGWYQTCENLGQTARFLEDVDLAWKLADSSSNIGLQCGYQLIMTSINSVAQNIPPDFLLALVAKGVWSIKQGIAYAQQVTEAEQRFRALTGLVSLTDKSPQEEIVQKASEAAEKIELRHKKVPALIELVTHFSKPFTEDILQESLNIDAERTRCESLKNLFSHLSESQAIQALSSVQPFEDEQKRAEAIVALTQHLPEPGKKEALSMVLKIEKEWIRAEALAEMACHLPESLVIETFEAARIISDKENQARAFVGIGPFLPDVPWEELLTRIESIKTPERRYRAFASLIPKTPPAVLQKRLATIHAIESERKRADSLIEICSYLYTGPLVKKAFTIAQSFTNENVRIRALKKIAPQMIILGLSKEFFLEVQNIKEQAAQLELIPLLTIDGHFQQAISIINTIESTGKRDDALIELVSRLKSSELYDEALLKAKSIESEWRKAAVLSWLSQDLPENTLRAAFEIVENFENNSHQTQVLMGLIPRLAELGYVEEALNKAKDIPQRERQTEILSRLATHLPERLLKEALSLLQLGDNDERTEVLVELSPHLPETFLNEILLEIHTVRDEADQFALLLKLAPYLPEPLLRGALKTAQGMKSEDRQVRALVGMLPRFAELGYPQEVLNQTDTIANEYERIMALVELSLSLVKLNYHKEALIMIQKIEHERKQAEALIVAIPYLPASSLKQALDLALRITGESSRVEALIGLASRLPDDVMAALLSIGDENSRIRGLVALAPYLDEPSLREVFMHVQHIQKAYKRRDALIKLVPHLADSLLEETAEILQALGIHWKDVKKLERLAPYFPESLWKDALDKIWQIEEDDDGKVRVDVLIGLAPVLPGSFLEEILSTPTLKKLNYEMQGERLLRGVIPYVSGSLLERALILAQMINYREAQAEVLVSLTPYLSETLLEDALSVVQKLLANEHNIGKSLIGMLPKLLEFGHSKQALAIVESIDDEDDRAKALSKMIFCLADLKKFEEAKELAQLIPNKATRANTLIKLAPRLPEQYWKDVLENIFNITDKKYWARVLGQLVFKIEGLSRSLIYPFWQKTSLFINRRTRQELLSDIQSLIPVAVKIGGDEAIVELFHAIQDVGRWWP